MVRYKRRRYYKKSTNIVRMKFQSFYDISTSASSMQIFTISAGGPEIVRRLAAQFAAYKYYRLGNISVKLVPASTLPVDPTGLSLEAGESTVDPRDQLTPGMMRITNGEDVFEDISGLSADQQHGIYNNMLLDPRWFKWMLQSGVKRHATPRYWQIGQLHQDKYPGAIVNVPFYDTDGDLAGTDSVGMSQSGSAHNNVVQGQAGSSDLGIFQTGHSGVLGWLPTDGLVKSFATFTTDKVTPAIASPVECEVFKLITPKAYKTRYYYRMFVSQTVFFKEPIVNMGVIDASAYGYRPLDVFHASPTCPIPSMPDTAQPAPVPDSYTGGNYGNN